jgi:hypothetical protein
MWRPPITGVIQAAKFWGLDSDRILQLFIGEIILAKQVDVLP